MAGPGAQTRGLGARRSAQHAEVGVDLAALAPLLLDMGHQGALRPVAQGQAEALQGLGIPALRSMC